MMTDRDKLWNENAVAAYLDCSLSAVRKGRIGIGCFADLPFVKFGKAVRYVPDTVRAYAAQKEMAPQ